MQPAIFGDEGEAAAGRLATVRPASDTAQGQRPRRAATVGCVPAREYRDPAFTPRSASCGGLRPTRNARHPKIAGRALGASARIGAVRDGAVPYGGDSDDSIVVSQLVDDPVGTDPQRPQPAKAAAEFVTRAWFAFE